MEGDRYTPANRAGCAIIAFGLTYAVIFSAIFENSISYVSQISNTVLVRREAALSLTVFLFSQGRK